MSHQSVTFTLSSGSQQQIEQGKVSAVKLLEYFSINIDIQNVNQI